MKRVEREREERPQAQLDHYGHSRFVSPFLLSSNTTPPPPHCYTAPYPDSLALILCWLAAMSWHIWHSAPRVSPVFSQHSEAKGGKEGKEGEFAPVAFKGCLEAKLWAAAWRYLSEDGFLHLPPFLLS